MTTKTTKTEKTAAQLIAELRNCRDDRGAAWITEKNVAKLVRARLADAFPGVKFSVRSRSNVVNIRWTDGPTQCEVDAIVTEYKFGGFDGSIDLAYSGSNWLLPSGEMIGAASCGTQGSGGYVAAFATDCPKPGAIIVKGGPDYVFTQREVSDERMAQMLEAAARHYGFEVRADQPIWKQTHNGDYITTLAHKLEQDEYKYAAA